MGAKHDITGKVYGRLTAVRLLRSGGAGIGRIWLLQCSCGQAVERRTGNLKESSSCGCAESERREAMVMDLMGQSFGRLTVVGRARNREGSQGPRWRCRCACGHSHIARSKDLRLGTTSSCGCKKTETRKSKSGGPGAPRLVIPLDSRFGRLRVDSLPTVVNGFRYYACACDCGGKTVVRGTLLRNGQTRSCGCLRREGRTSRAVVSASLSDDPAQIVRGLEVQACTADSTTRIGPSTPPDPSAGSISSGCSSRSSRADAPPAASPWTP